MVWYSIYWFLCWKLGLHSYMGIWLWLLLYSVNTQSIKSLKQSYNRNSRERWNVAMIEWILNWNCIYYVIWIFKGLNWRYEKYVSNRKYLMNFGAEYVKLYTKYYEVIILQNKCCNDACYEFWIISANTAHDVMVFILCES